eukprot:GGOE01015608.1.p2 GENE.GGOE01015608.1~~GGOE01015608.1.p2  ORF type:complete len:123 (+),score=1.84 GGOE01015608.1:219-587(+)
MGLRALRRREHSSAHTWRLTPALLSAFCGCATTRAPLRLLPSIAGKGTDWHSVRTEAEALGLSDGMHAENCQEEPACNGQKKLARWCSPGLHVTQSPLPYFRQFTFRSFRGNAPSIAVTPFS